MFFKKRKCIEFSNSDFPLKDNNPQVVFFDNACTSLKPNPVINAISDYYRNLGSCALRSPHCLGVETTNAISKARKKIANFLGLKTSDEVIFTRSATDSINLLAESFQLNEGDEVVVSSLEHNSNFLPWMSLGERNRVKTLIWDIDPRGQYSLLELEKLLSRKEVKLLSLFSDSNIIPLSLPIDKIVEIAHRHGVKFHVDASQTLLHRSLDIYKLEIDYLSFSFHKLMGPHGIGVLALRKENYQFLRPSRLGGETVLNVNDNSYVLAAGPACFEPGVGSYAAILGAAAAVDYISAIGYRKIKEKDEKISQLLIEGISRINKINKINKLGPDIGSHLLNFSVDSLDSGELALLLDRNFGIMARAGVHCGHFWYNRYKLVPSLRISSAFYNEESDVECLISALNEVTSSFL